MHAAVLGSPIGHSLSPALHRAAYTALGLDWSYEAVEVTERELPGFLCGLGPEWVGLSLTMPLKTAVLPLLDEVDPLVTRVGAANTVLLASGRRAGANTDVSGIVASLWENGVHRVQRGAVLGAGATARSAIAALAQLGERRPRLAARRHPQEILDAARRLGSEPQLVGLDAAALSGCDLVISTLPPGAGEELPALARGVARVPLLLDVTYAPWPTALAAACGGRVVSGLGMLLYQAAAQVELMTGRPAPLAAMRGALKGYAG